MTGVVPKTAGILRWVCLVLSGKIWLQSKDNHSLYLLQDNSVNVLKLGKISWTKEGLKMVQSISLHLAVVIHQKLVWYCKLDKMWQANA
ncbi:unnamed protein product [Dovyalis caffra]|uniref:Uncharacterized protein n=1 Tax=Dovyalis caffra TaxID=77055 RepID=A0AAV1RSM2_9ROSI|nr:unnamed protein product [Dovyalis caffra]